MKLGHGEAYDKWHRLFPQLRYPLFKDLVKAEDANSDCDSFKRTSIWKWIVHRQSDRCIVCYKPNIEPDHILPLRGSLFKLVIFSTLNKSFANVLPLCPDCNRNGKRKNGYQFLLNQSRETQNCVVQYMAEVNRQMNTESKSKKPVINSDFISANSLKELKIRLETLAQSQVETTDVAEREVLNVYWRHCGNCFEQIGTKLNGGVVPKVSLTLWDRFSDQYKERTDAWRGQLTQEMKDFLLANSSGNVNSILEAWFSEETPSETNRFAKGKLVRFLRTKEIKNDNPVWTVLIGTSLVSAEKIRRAASRTKASPSR